ncbi:MAG: 1-phosphofructokinase [Clostridium sp.]|jgi:1-phosphofructokinase|uniref:1-phosphofructokinase n=1 Tax=Clostridium sp. TaxID=1506 RepID=UPI0025BAA0D4|nr:1-phosphofructokinase [Clostridium sp.]MCH3965016.1 1-phosphofructokinase [Clostridium sp.]MCI1714237.1 1-phosphofructokinase [Clostridium sp.]MCI1798499.1 1-phosphofructokinase [Clostridium sp.]MCI1812770.1 1-phosphofructokinase [Clostridium sp.]MCI1869308.1 1-phosphofructokinase [Clostridium sp.]
MIYTVTFNPSIDYVIQVDDFTVGTINRVKNDEKYAGGKGINVSRVLKNIGVESRALGFIGGFTGKFIEDSLRDAGISTDFIQVQQDTRINVKLKSVEETEINGSGPDISRDDLNKLFEKVKDLKEDDFIVLAGNVQKSVPRNIYSTIQTKCGKGKVVVDTTGEALADTLQYSPLLIKPNIHELGELFDVEIKETEKVIYYAQKLRGTGAQNVIVSMGKEGALLICSEGVYSASAPEGEVKNSVGSGDSLVAGFLSRYTKGSSIVDAFKYGAAAGSATAFSMDLCRKEDIERLLPEVEIKRL